MEEEATEPSGRRCGLYLSAIVVALFFVRVLGEPWDTNFPPQFPDALNPGRTDTYYAVAGLTPFRPSFYWAPRPVLYPAFVWLFGRSSHLVVLAQMAAYCTAVGVVCLTALQAIRTRLIANATVVVIVLIAVQARFALWNTQILSESLGLSLGIMMVAMWWRVAAASSPRRVTWAWVWTVLWLLERDAHTVPIVVVLVPVAVGIGVLAKGLSMGVRRRLVAGSMVGLLVCGYVYVAAQVSGRNRYSMYNTIGMRVLGDPPLREWFVNGGMPLDAALLGRQGKTAFDDNRFFVNDPSLARFRRWADGPGSRRMVLSLVVRAPDWVRLQAKQWGAILDYDYDAYDSYGVVDRLPTRTPFQLGGPRSPDALRIWLLVAVGAACLAATRSTRRGLVAFSFSSLAFVFVEMYTSLAADPLEAERHLVGPVNRLTVILVVCIAIGVDALWQARLAVPASDRGGDREQG